MTAEDRCAKLLGTERTVCCLSVDSKHSFSRARQALLKSERLQNLEEALLAMALVADRECSNASHLRNPGD